MQLILAGLAGEGLTTLSIVLACFVRQVLLRFVLLFLLPLQCLAESFSQVLLLFVLHLGEALQDFHLES